MIAILQPAFLKGKLMAPASKSSMQRACAAALLCRGVTTIVNPGVSADDQAAVSIISALGAQIESNNGQLIIKSPGFPSGNIFYPDELNGSESGLSIRMFIPIASLLSHPIHITGTGTVLQRTMEIYESILPALNVDIQTTEGKLPVRIKGPMVPDNCSINGSVSSQFLTGLLFAFSAADAKDVTIQVDQLKSKPYIDLTLDVMRRFGMKMPLQSGYDHFYFEPASHTYSGSERTYQVEGDWSGAAFMLVAGAIRGNIMVTGLDPFTTQADKKILEALTDAGVVMSITPDCIHVQQPDQLNAFHFDATDCPDLFPPLSVLAVYASGTSVIRGTSRLVHKESNRALSLQQEWSKMGIEVQLQDDLMIIRGGQPRAARVFSHHDHRIAMAMAIASMGATGEVSIEAADCVRKSWPGFFECLQLLGGNVSLSPTLN